MKTVKAKVTKTVVMTTARKVTDVDPERDAWLSKELDELVRQAGPIMQSNTTQSADPYKEDFEDYEDDFETYVPPKPSAKDLEMDEVLQALQEENARVKDFRPKTPVREADTPKPPVLDSREMDAATTVQVVPEKKFTALPQRSFAPLDVKRANKIAPPAKPIMSLAQRQERFKDLKNLIDFDIASYVLLDLPPMSEYELYIRNMGKTNAIQATTQTNEESFDRECQTENVETQIRFTQAPYDPFIGSGLEKETEKKNWMAFLERPLTQKEAWSLGNFIRQAARVCETLIEEQLAAEDHDISETFPHSSHFPFSCGSDEIPTRFEFLEGRSVLQLALAPSDSHLLLTSWSPPKINAVHQTATMKWIQSNSLLCIWHLNDLTKPQKLLLCPSSEIATCCFGVEQSFLVFAGTKEGSVLVWDLREAESAASLHWSPDLADTFEGEETPVWAFHEPSYITAGMNKHTDSIVFLSSLINHSLLAVDASGVQSLWSVVDWMSKSMTATESAPFDTHLRPESLVQLKWAHQQQLSFTDSSRVTSATLCGKESLLIGTENGTLLLFQGEKLQQQFTHTSFIGDGFMCLVPCPCSPRHFLAGFQSGHVCLYDMEQSAPLLSWPALSEDNAFRPFVLQWSAHRPSVFLRIVSDQLQVFDLTEQNHSPIWQCPIKVPVLGQDLSAIVATRESRTASLIFAFESGHLQIHGLDESLVEMAMEEDDIYK